MNSHEQDLIFTLLEFNFYLPYHRRRALTPHHPAAGPGHIPEQEVPSRLSQIAQGHGKLVPRDVPKSVLPIPREPPPGTLPGQEGAALLESGRAALRNAGFAVQRQQVQERGSI